jgi:protein TonB
MNFRLKTARHNPSNWALTRGVVGADQRALSPSLTALGRNIYLTPLDFLRMLVLALLVHLVVVGILSLWPYQPVQDIPVRALSFRLGEGEVVAVRSTNVTAPAPMQALPAPSAAPSASTSGEWRAPKAATPPTRKPQAPKRVRIEAPPAPVSMPIERAIEAPPTRYVREYGLPSLDSLFGDDKTANAAKPSIGDLTQVPPTVPNAPFASAGGEGSSNETEASIEAIRQRYEQQISGWIARHRVYPPEAKGEIGRVIVRMRINRAGYVRYYALEESSGNAALDAAALAMIRRANPMPTPPSNYPAGNLIEFLIPINFEKPAV